MISFAFYDAANGELAHDVGRSGWCFTTVGHQLERDIYGPEIPGIASHQPEPPVRHCSDFQVFLTFPYFAPYIKGVFESKDKNVERGIQKKGTVYERCMLYMPKDLPMFAIY